jgi:hypothetical protein
MNVMFRTAPSSGAAWFVVNTHSNREDLAGRNLANQGYEVYAPVLQMQIRHARRVRQVLRPLFPGYLFVRSGPCETRWRPVLSTLGVRSVVRNGDDPLCQNSARRPGSPQMPWMSRSESSQHKAEQSNAWRTSAPSAFQEREISRWKRAGPYGQPRAPIRLARASFIELHAPRRTRPVRAIRLECLSLRVILSFHQG